jgi:hypothetical protein
MADETPDTTDEQVTPVDAAPAAPEETTPAAEAEAPAEAPAAEAAEPAETRMGSGKGSPEGWVAVVKPGRVMFELAGVPEPLAREALRLAGMKLPVPPRS